MDAEAVADAIASRCMDEFEEAIENDRLDEYINSIMVVLNGFQFCKDHGNEYCTHCEGDSRLLNNDELPKAAFKKLKKSIWAGMDPRKRPPICDVYARFNPIPTGKIHPFRRSELYACEPHRDIDCERCFNWVEILQEKKQKEGTVADRRQILGLLKSMGIELSPDTKMKDNVLEKKLSGALTASQSLSSYGPSSLNPLELPLWTGTGKASAFEAMPRTNVNESLRVYENKVAGKPDPFPLYENAFMDARQTSRHFAYHFAAGRKSLVMKDEGDSQAICIRLLEIYKLDKDTPLISLIYETATSSEPNGCRNTIPFISHLANSGGVPQINATVEEQALFRKLLAENSRRVSVSFKPKKECYEETFKPSFVVPIGPISQIDIGKLTHNTGCEICGSKTTSRCSQCQSASYCGSVCQRAHWPEHKAMCKSLKGGTWQTIKFHTNIRVDGQLLTCAHINYQGPIGYTVEAKSDVPVNVHGDQAFLIKLQRQLSEQEMTLPFISQESRKSEGRQAILVYDRQRSFCANVWDFTNVGVFEKVLAHIWAEENQKKMYRWAKRVGDHELSVCLDRSPVPVPTW